MADSSVAVTPGSGKNLQTWNRTVNAVSVEDEVVLLGEPYLASYSVVTGAITTNTGNDHLLQIMAGASLRVRVRRIVIELFGVPAAAATMAIHMFRLTSAGSGGTAITPLPFDPSDAASGFTAMTQPTVKGTEAAAPIKKWSLGAPAAQPASALYRVEWVQLPMQKPLQIAAGTGNGFAFKLVVVGGAASSAVLSVEADESSFV